MKFNIQRIGLPAAHFSSGAALAEFQDEAADYERAVAEYAATGDDLLLQIDLEALGYGWSDIEWHIVNPGKRMQQGFGCDGDFPVDAQKS